MEEDAPRSRFKFDEEENVDGTRTEVANGVDGIFLKVLYLDEDGIDFNKPLVPSSLQG